MIWVIKYNCFICVCCRYLDQDGDDEDDEAPNKVVHDSDENLSEDERTVEQMEHFEHKYNFRFEEPDQDFVKRYPRTMNSSLRQKDDRRKVHREELKERKEREKEAKRQELKQLKAVKRKEIAERLEKLKEITGNTDINFEVGNVTLLLLLLFNFFFPLLNFLHIKILNIVCLN